jgi:hypothetical protein
MSKLNSTKEPGGPKMTRLSDPQKQTGYPVVGFPMQFTWQTGDWVRIFDAQVKQIQEDIARARSEDRLIIYLSCPISSRGGGLSLTNVDIASFTARRIMNEWGSRFWVLNPSAYQLESKQGTGLIHRLAEEVRISEKRLAHLKAKFPPKDGDYMRMWTKVLVEDDDGQNLGGRFAAYYFLGPNDVRHFFDINQTTTLTAAVEEYFARQYTINQDFHAFFSEPFCDSSGKPIPKKQWPALWHRRRLEFFRFYSLRGSAGYSKGSHDEWNIFVTLNKLRLEASEGKGYGLGSQIAGYFAGSQIPPGASECTVAHGYEV